MSACMNGCACVYAYLTSAFVYITTTKTKTKNNEKCFQQNTRNIKMKEKRVL